jgi:hypothetical protein
VDDERVRELVAQEAEARNLDRVTPLLPRVSLDVDQLHLEQIPRLRVLHVYRPRQRMHRVQVQLLDVRLRGPAVQLPVEGVARLVDDRVAGVHFHRRLYGLVPAVVPRAWLLGERP